MKKIITTLSLLALTACGDMPETNPCTSPNETGIVKSNVEWTKHIPGFRGPGYDQPMTTIAVEVKGAVRICEVDAHAASLLPVGTKVSLINAVRKY